MQIRRLTLYSKTGEIRDLPFALGKVNIITGPSERGKSAILAIIDYCLGASQLGVPAGIIQDAVAWYALELDFAGDRLFVARPGVGPDRTASSLFHISPGGSTTLPPVSELQASFSRKEFLEKISAKIGVSTTLIPRAGGDVARKELSFRSALIYCFQKQNEIANPDLFFHRQSNPSIAQVIRDTLPYYLGAINEDALIREAELKAKRKRLKDVKKRLDHALSIDARRDDDGAYLVAEAERCGLLPQIKGSALPEQYAVLLEQAEELSRAPIDGQGTDQLRLIARALTQADGKRESIEREIEALSSFGMDQRAVLSGVNEQRLRLRSLELIPDAASGHHESCPVCTSPMQTPPPSARALRQSLTTLEQELGFVVMDQSKVVEAIAERKSQLTDVNADIATLRSQIARLREEDVKARGTLERRNASARVGGMIQMFLRASSISSNDEREALSMEISALETAIESLEGTTDFTSFKTRTATFLGSIGQTITAWARKQKLGYSYGLLTFDIRGPQLVSETDAGTIPFSRFGSGKNWVWYHLLGHMALHRWFVDRNRPVPRFLAIDQPSQVYFPAGEDEEGATDLAEVRKIYDWLISQTRSMDGEFQVILTDHANFPDDQDFVDHVVADWWSSEERLVPDAWS